MRILLSILTLAAATAMASMPGPYAPAAGQIGSTAVPLDDARIVGWATAAPQFNPGRINIEDLGAPLAGWGTKADALGMSDAESSDSFAVVSLGDGGSITLTFGRSFADGPGPDLAVFENAFSDTFLELAFVEVSSDGVNFHRFPSVSLTQTETQVGSFGLLDPTNLHNLAGKYRRGFGTPFDLSELAGIATLDIGHVTHVRVVDVVGSLDLEYRRLDSQGHPVNDPWTTEFETCGFDLDAVALLAIPEPATLGLLITGLGLLAIRRKRKAE